MYEAYKVLLPPHPKPPIKLEVGLSGINGYAWLFKDVRPSIFCPCYIISKKGTTETFPWSDSLFAFALHSTLQADFEALAKIMPHLNNEIIRFCACVYHSAAFALYPKEVSHPAVCASQLLCRRR